LGTALQVFLNGWQRLGGDMHAVGGLLRNAGGIIQTVARVGSHVGSILDGLILSKFTHAVAVLACKLSIYEIQLVIDVAALRSVLHFHGALLRRQAFRRSCSASLRALPQ